MPDQNISPETMGGILALAIGAGWFVGRRIKGWAEPVTGAAKGLLQQFIKAEFHTPLGRLQEENARLSALVQAETLRREAQANEQEFRIRVLEGQTKEILSELQQVRRELERGHRYDEMQSEKLAEICEIVAAQKGMQTAQADGIELLSGQLNRITDFLIANRKDPK